MPEQFIGHLLLRRLLWQVWCMDSIQLLSRGSSFNAHDYGIQSSARQGKSPVAFVAVRASASATVIAYKGCLVLQLA